MKLKRLLVDLYCLQMSLRGRLNPTRINHNKLTILTFHRCLPEKLRQQYYYPGLVITPEELDWLLERLKKHFVIGTISEVFDQYQNNPNAQPPILGLSFDDGQWDNLHYAHPVLNKHGVNATFYIPTQPVDKQRLIWHDIVSMGARYFMTQTNDKKKMWREILPGEVDQYVEEPVGLVEALKQSEPKEIEILCAWLNKNIPSSYWPEWTRMMTWDEVRELQSFGHEIGSHCVTHNILPQLSDKNIREEIVQSKLKLEQECGKPVTSLCYPNGDYDDRCCAVAKECGYSHAVSTSWGLSDLDTDHYGLNRIDISPQHHLSFMGNLSINKTWLRISGQSPGMKSR